MQNIIKKYFVCLILLVLIFSIVMGPNTSALESNVLVQAFGQEWEIVDGEVYYCYESIAECVKHLEPPFDDEVFMDDTPWSFVLEVADGWWYSSTYFYKIDGPVKDNYPFIQPESITKLKNKNEDVEQKIKNYVSSVALDKVDKRLAVTLRGPYESNNGKAKFIFKAPKSGKVILFNEDLIEGATPNSNFKAFGSFENSGYIEMCVMKDEVVISDTIEISTNNMKAEFPKVGNSGEFTVDKGDEIVVYVKSFENVSENNTIFMNPVIAYTEIVNTDDSFAADDFVDKTEKDLSLFIVLGGILMIFVFAMIIVVKCRCQNNKKQC